MVLVGEIGTLRRTEGDMEFVSRCTFDRGGHALTGLCPMDKPIPLDRGRGLAFGRIVGAGRGH
jgi:hypothetical protein